MTHRSIINRILKRGQGIGFDQFSTGGKQSYPPFVWITLYIVLAMKGNRPQT
ncbi:TPA: hypothetical protein ON641_002658 [Proteus mirabilis]|nr:hypothetical protein [Proteus mirabilis]